MRKSIVFIISVLLIVLLIGQTFCEVVGDGIPITKFFDLNGNEVSEQQFNDNICRMLGEPTAAEWRAQQANKGQGSASAQPAAASAPNTTASAPATPKEKLTVYFTDAFGNALGSSQVTKGTTIAESQFVQDVPECDGKTFDHWDYDGRVIEHQYIVRALYK